MQPIFYPMEKNVPIENESQKEEVFKMAEANTAAADSAATAKPEEKK